MTIKTITATALKDRLNRDEVLLIDVREHLEHKDESIEGACLIPLAEISVEKLPSIKRPIVIYCKLGKRSADACARLLVSNPSLDLYSLEGGIVAWRQSGFNVKRSNSCVLPLGRQTQVALGIIIFSGTTLGTYVNSIFYIFPGFIGAGLIFAGISGWCGMTRLLAKMPWNN